MIRKMTSYYNLLAICLVFLLACVANSFSILNIKQYGAVADGKTDSTKALQQAWREGCAAQGGAQITIPQGDYMVGPVLFKGPCNGSVTIQLDGNLLADTNLGRYTKSTWLDFQYINGITIKGQGTLDGRGELAWPYNTCPKKWQCKILPMNLALSLVTNGSVEGITSINSKFFHMNIFASKNIDIRRVTIKAPDESPNTDGIHMGASTNVSIVDCNIGTGDDCVSIGSGNSNVTVSGVTCGPGHGISIGSLGKGADKGDVIGLTVKNCTITRTMNGIRIKTWQSKPGGGSVVSIRVEDFTFDNIVMNNVSNPIIIDQEYCPYAACPESEPSLVKIKRVKFKNIRGTSSSSEVIKLICSQRHPCEGVELYNIHLLYTGNNPALNETATCVNAYGTASNVKPVTCF